MIDHDTPTLTTLARRCTQDIANASDLERETILAAERDPASADVQALRLIVERHGGGAEADRRRIADLEEALRPFSRADQAIGLEPGPFRFETGHGYRLIERHDLAQAGKVMRGCDGLRATTPTPSDAGRDHGEAGRG